MPRVLGVTTAIVLPLRGTPLLPTTPDTALRRDGSGPFRALSLSAAPCQRGVCPVLVPTHGRAEPADPLVHGTMATVWFGDEQ